MYEIEKKFLVFKTLIPFPKTFKKIKQGYISNNKKHIVRVRTIETNDEKKAFLTIKGKNKGISRFEFEQEISFDEGEALINEFCTSLIEKTRYLIDYENHTFEVDVFDGDNKGLIIAEVELEDENEELKLPRWIDKDVSIDSKYYNNNLLKKPFNKW